MSENPPFFVMNPRIISWLCYAHHFHHGSVAPFVYDRKGILLLHSKLRLGLGDTRAVWKKVVNLSDSVRRCVGRFLLPEIANVLTVCR